MIAPEEKLLKRYIDSRKKEYLEFAKQNEKGVAAAIELKQTATRVTIEGEHVCLFVVRRVNAPPADLAFFDTAALVNQTRPAFEIEITPILNAPYQLAQVTLPLQDLKAVLTYRYLFERKAIRLLTRTESREYIICFKSQRHKDKALRCITKLA